MNKITLIKEGDKISIVYHEIQIVTIMVDDIIMEKIKNGDIKEVQEFMNKKALEIFDK